MEIRTGSGAVSLLLLRRANQPRAHGELVEPRRQTVERTGPPGLAEVMSTPGAEIWRTRVREFRDGQASLPLAQRGDRDDTFRTPGSRCAGFRSPPRR